MGQTSLGSGMEGAEGVEAMSWIKSSERHPDGDIVCWVFLKKTRRVYVCRFNAHYKCWDDESGDDFRYRDEEVSHWQPYVVPRLPSE